jgi:ABC-type antimicrobial peptide transport system permease subunit
MLKNHLKVAIRIIIRHKAYSVINIAGLAIGMACCIIILLWVRDELSFDRFHEKADQIYIVIVESHSADQVRHQMNTPAPLAAALKKEIPEISHSSIVWKLQEELVQYQDKSFMESGFWLCGTDFFEIFTFPFLIGDVRKALSNPNSVVITENVADKYFAGENPLGKTIILREKLAFTVTGVVRNIPQNSHLRFDFLAPFSAAPNLTRDPSFFESWNVHSYATYVQIQEGIPVERINQKISNFMDGRVVEALTERLYLLPLKDIHLRSNHIRPNVAVPGDVRYVFIFSAIAILILFVACINFMNLATARSSNRATEVALRKVVGANRGQLIKQFFRESLLLSFPSLLLAVVLVELLLPVFRNISGKNLSVYAEGNEWVFPGLIAIAFLTGILSGSYPSFILSGFQPVKVIRGILKSGGSGGVLFRKVLVVSQFAFSISLIICTMVVLFQVRYMQNRETGLDKEHVIHLPLRGDMGLDYAAIKSELLKNPQIISTTIASTVPRRGIALSGPADRWEGALPKERYEWFLIGVGPDYLETFKLKMAEGRFFQNASSDEKQREPVVINETAARAIGENSPLGVKFTFWGIECEVMGVVKDFHFRSMHHPIGPLILANMPGIYRFVFVKVNIENLAETISYLEKVWANFFPGYPFEYHFFDESFDSWYRTERRIGSLFNSFTWLAIFISCLGLFGLASFMAEQRTKEIGIRKVLGASVSDIVLMLSKEFAQLVILANLISWPIAYFAMRSWLQNFAYQMPLGIWIFFAAGLLTLVIAWLTVSVQAVRAALSDPVHSLKYE